MRNLAIKLYVSTYKKYNDGSLAGDWFEITGNDDADEILEKIQAFHDDETDCEFMVQDYDSDDDGLLEFIKNAGLDGECLQLDELIECLELLNDATYDLPVYAAYASNLGGYDDISSLIDSADDAYSGEYDSDSDFAESLADELGYMNEAKSWPFTCIDWDYAARELMYDYFEINGYYFRNN